MCLTLGPFSTSERANLTVDVHGRATARDHLHDSSDPPVVETLPKQNFPKEGQTNSVVGLVKINFQENRLKVFRPDLMENFVKN